MVKLVAQRLVVTWIALSAILFAALSPTISHALSAAVAATETVQVCTAQGMVTVTVDKADAGKPAPAPDHLAKHCTYCATHGGAPALLPGQAFVVPPATVLPVRHAAVCLGAGLSPRASLAVLMFVPV
jgi:hypothetical protein